MEPKFQTSFIPKKQISIGSDALLPPIRGTGILSFLATIIFVVTLVAMGGMYGYKIILNKQVVQADSDLASSRASFEPDTINNLIDVSSRIMSAQQLLKNHVVLSELFNVLQSLTVKKVKFSNFSFKKQNNLSVVSMDGEAQSYNALAAQADVFSKSEFIKNPVFSDFALSETGMVTVKFTATIDPSLISYKRLVDSVASPTPESTESTEEDNQTP